MRKLLALIILLTLALANIAQTKVGGGAKIGGAVKVAVTAAGGGETNFVNDTFTESGSDVELSTHTAELGGPWVISAAPAYGNFTSVLASADRIYADGTSAYYATATPPSADYCSEGVIFVASIIAVNASVTVRMDTTADTMYIFRLNSGTSWDVRRIVAGAQTTLPAATTSTSNLPGVGESRTMKLCISGGATPTLAAYVDGVHLSTLGGLDGSPITATGKAGFRFSGVASSTTGYHFTSFRAFTP